MSTRPETSPYTIALTGGIASGKSAVGRCFEDLGIHVWDADIAAREVVAVDTPGLAAVVKTFGPGVLQADGSLDRRALRTQVFSDADARRQLEAIIHPRVNDWLQAHAQADDGRYCILAVPLLAETWPQYAWVDRVLLVEAPRETRMQRLMQRDGMDTQAAERMLAAQASDAQRRAIAHDIIHNNDTLQALRAQVEKLHQGYLSNPPL